MWSPGREYISVCEVCGPLQRGLAEWYRYSCIVFRPIMTSCSEACTRSPHVYKNAIPVGFFKCRLHVSCYLKTWVTMSSWLRLKFIKVHGHKGCLVPIWDLCITSHILTVSIMPKNKVYTKLCTYKGCIHFCHRSTCQICADQKKGCAYLFSIVKKRASWWVTTHSSKKYHSYHSSGL